MFLHSFLSVMFFQILEGSPGQLAQWTCILENTLGYPWTSILLGQQWVLPSDDNELIGKLSISWDIQASECSLVSSNHQGSSFDFFDCLHISHVLI